MAVGIYFALQPYVGTEEIGWMCILGAAPFAACGFFTYHGMTAEQVLWVWFKSEILCPKRLEFKSDSYYYEAMQPAIRAGMKRKRGNSEFLVMLNQSATDRAELAKLLNISDNQLGYVTNVPAGCGLIRCAGNIVPFTNSFPKDTKLYKLMSTNPSEKRE